MTATPLVRHDTMVLAAPGISFSRCGVHGAPDVPSSISLFSSSLVACVDVQGKRNGGMRRRLGEDVEERVRRLGNLYAAQQSRVRAPAADDRDGAAAWRGDVEGIQKASTSRGSRTRPWGGARPQVCAPARTPR
jgi:hypothetical protein